MVHLTPTILINKKTIEASHYILAVPRNLVMMQLFTKWIQQIPWFNIEFRIPTINKIIMIRNISISKIMNLHPLISKSKNKNNRKSK